VFVGENSWCFLFYTYVDHSLFFIYMSSFRPRCVTIVILHRTRGQSCTSARRHAAFTGLPLKSGEQAAGKSVQIQSLQHDLVLSWLPASTV